LKARREDGPERPRERRAEQHERADRIDGSVETARHDEDRDADEPEKYSGEQVAADALSGDDPVNHDPKRDRRNDERRDSRRNRAFGKDDQTVGHSEQEDPDRRGAGELLLRDTEVDPSESEPRGKEESGKREP